MVKPIISGRLSNAIHEANSSFDKVLGLDNTMRQICCLMDFVDNVEEFMMKNNVVPVNYLHRFTHKNVALFVDIALLSAGLGTSPAELVALATHRADEAKKVAARKLGQLALPLENTDGA
jgi:hypothetical protein